MIPVCEPTLNGNEKKYVLDCLDTNWISSNGKYIELFETKFAEFCNVKYGVSCSNGTTALHLALAVLNIGKDDEVIIPDFTMIATINSVLYTGAKPIVVDSEMQSWNMDVDKIEEKITEKTKVIMVVHTYGHPINMEKVNEIAKKHNLFVIEDAAEAHGAEFNGKKIGSLSDIACFSFYANKIITTGEGGMIVTNNEKYAERAKLLKNHAFTKPRFVHHEIGFNYRMTNIQAAIGLAQVENVDKLVEARIKNAQLYNQKLKDVKGVILPPEQSNVKNVYWMYGILIEKEFGMSAKEVMEKLNEKGIETRTFFVPMHKQPMFNFKGEYPVSEHLSEHGFYLPSASHLTEENIDYIVECIKGLQ